MGMGGVGGGGSGGGRRRRRKKSGIMSEINVTPMVDVMLVLLIIMMVAAPMLTSGVPVDLPRTAASELPSQTRPITVSVSPEGAIFVDEAPVTETDLVSTVGTLATVEDRVYLRGDTTANYGTVMRVMGLLSAAGYTKIGLVTERER
ncbi:ExbD/TolR family protein [Devosia sp. XJ19-1]|uniref:ExbD/TolR family protein n=1 Tax=Devosia ureilytica TaxID=2952754 RepID=A0A9Q4AQB2_9HYPH|nr:ExbD/TolR family protein [Devosia ureilytica]MCP8884517.1 ExbD/TolR family protein [Devosia ureilytica]MCP8888147.1 ExbD/TolR family protein [Devosia ureilytica]